MLICRLFFNFFESEFDIYCTPAEIKLFRSTLSGLSGQVLHIKLFSSQLVLTPSMVSLQIATKTEEAYLHFRANPIIDLFVISILIYSTQHCV